MAYTPPEPKPGFWDRVRNWADNNRTIAGALGGLAVGSVVPGVGNVIGAIIGAGVGFVSSHEKKAEKVE